MVNCPPTERGPTGTVPAPIDDADGGKDSSSTRMIHLGLWSKSSFLFFVVVAAGGFVHQSRHLSWPF